MARIKPKLLAWCDFLVPTGFGNVAHNLLDNMHTDFDVTVVGINFYGNKRYDSSKYFVFPVNEKDPLGFRTLLDVAQKEQPHLIFLFQDIFHISELLPHLKKASPASKIVVYFPVDGAPFSKDWVHVLDSVDTVITYSDWAIEVIRDAAPNFKGPILKLYHGVDTSIFRPLEQAEILKYKNESKLAGKFVVVNVNRYQPRKGIQASLRAFSIFAKGYKRCKCGNIMPYHNRRCDVNWCPESDIVEAVKRRRDDVFYYMHMMSQEASMGPGPTNTLQQHVKNAGFTEDDYGKIIGINGKDIYSGQVGPQDVNVIYNIANVNISTSLGEGKLIAGTKVLTDSGYKLIENISPTDKVLNDKGKFTLVNKTAKYTGGECYKVKLSKFTEPIILSGDHRLLTTSGYKRADALTKLDRIKLKTPNYLSIPAMPEIVDLADYLGDYSKKHYSIGETTISTNGGKFIMKRYLTLNADFYKFLGLYTGDGSPSSMGVNFCFHKKETNLHDFIINYFMSNLTVSGYITPKVHQSKKDASVSILIPGRALKNLMIKLASTGAHNKTMPIGLLNSNTQFKEAYIEGLLLSDGSKHKNEQSVRLRTVSPYLAYSVRDLFLSLGIVVSVSFENNSLGYGTGNIYSIVWYVDNNGNKDKGQFTKKYALVDNNVELDVLSVEKYYSNDSFYDLEVPEQESYAIGQCTSHNCGLSLLESQAAGTPNIAPRNSAIPEQLRGTGKLINNVGVFAQAMDNAHLRPLVNPAEMAFALDEMYDEWKAAKSEKVVNQACIDNVNKNFLWPDKVQFLKNVFFNILGLWD